MSYSPSPCKRLLADKAAGLGIEKIGFAVATPVSDDAADRYRRWISSGRHGEMNYLERYGDVRDNPQLLLPSARTIICCAINYLPERRQRADAPQIASYALGRDYHEVVRERLEQLAAFLRDTYGGETRVCVDTAPIRERYWAVRSGIGFIGRNNQLILPGKGSYFFLGEILSTVEFEPDEPCTQSCGSCGACLKACPTGTLTPDGTIDARRCISYLTIEHRGELPDGIPMGNRLYGCDSCQKACPHNKGAQPTTISDFYPSETLLNLNYDNIGRMTQEEFSSLFRHSAIKRTKLAGLQRNLQYIMRAKNSTDRPSDPSGQNQDSKTPLS